MKRLGVVLFALLVWATAAVGGSLLTADEAARRAEAGAITVIDVRSPGEWRRTGTPPGAMRITINDPDGAAGFLRRVDAAMGGHRDRPIALICARGSRSARAQDLLTRNGFTNVHNVAEGMLGNRDEPGWIARGLPVTPCKSC